MATSIQDNLLTDSWVPGLVEFLRDTENTEAVLFSPKDKKISVATLGPVNESELKAKLAETLQLLDAHDEQLNSNVPGGFTVRRMPGQILLERNTCKTAPKFWRWRDVDWPEEASSHDEAHDGSEWKFLSVMAALCGTAALFGFLFEQFSIGPAWLPILLYIVAICAGGYDALVDVIENIPKGHLDIHFLMLAVAAGACLIDKWAEGALLLFLFSTSAALEHFAFHRTHREISSLFKIAPKKAWVVKGGDKEVSVPVEHVVQGDVLIVRPGDVFPVDAEVISGSTAADESNLTGEANPVAKDIGDSVYSGTLNIWGVVQAKVLRPARESSLQKIIRLIQDAQHLKAPSQRLTDRFGTPYTIGILAVTVLMFFVWWLGFGISAFTDTAGSSSAFYRAMTLLVVASPCALVLSIPSTILAAIASGAKQGILFRGGAAIERLGEVDVVALDKTGTLTTGELKVVEIESFPEGNEAQVAQIAYSLEKGSTHPIARAITQYGKRENLKELSVSNFESMTGQGVKGRFDGAQCVLGRRELLEKGPLGDWAKNLPEPSAEYTEVWVIHENLLGRVLLQDQIRQESKPVLEALKNLNIASVMLTGDRSETAVEVGKKLGLEEVKASLTPEGKVNAIQAYNETGRKVAMVGDGVNDAPSLAAAYVSVAMGARGSDAALEQSEVVLMNDRIENFLLAYKLSRKARTIIKQNLFIAFGTILLMVLGAVAGVIPLTVGVFAHEGSTVLVCLNSLRLLFTQAD